MPALRLSSKRRRSSLGLNAFTPAKAGIYGISASRPVTFAPNVTPISYAEDEGSSSSDSESPSIAPLFPPSENPAPAPSRRRAPPGKRRSMGYIPRPPNAFMLFRADFVRQKHVPGTIETNHGSLSKIIGNCWRALPLEEKKLWEVKAKHAKAEHKARYPEYRFRPVHNKNKPSTSGKKDKPTVSPEEDRRCEEVAALLLEGKKGNELAAAVQRLDLMRSESPLGRSRHTQQQQQQGHLLRRPSSVPLPTDHIPFFAPISIPDAPFFTHGHGHAHSMSRPDSPLDPIARQQQRMMLGNRRASSARPAVHRSWTLPTPSEYPLQLQRDFSPLPDIDASLFNPSFFGGAPGEGGGFPGFHDGEASAHGQLFLASPASALCDPHHQDNALGPLDAVPPHDLGVRIGDYHQYAHAHGGLYAPDSAAIDPMLWLDPALHPHAHAQLHHEHDAHSQPSTAYSGSPASAQEIALPVVPSIPTESASGSPTQEAQVETPVVHAPQPQSAAPSVTAFGDLELELKLHLPHALPHAPGTAAGDLAYPSSAEGEFAYPHGMNMPLGMGMGMCGGPGDMDIGMGMGMGMGEMSVEGLLLPGMYGESFAAESELDLYVQA
ncbi:hypothetical protein H0H92_012711 [Tricholoma furcatifolium]|nr:hypothetical protein H0H92_012711 [Tricholoma furcatifolium]